MPRPRVQECSPSRELRDCARLAPQVRGQPLALVLSPCMTRAALFTFVGVVWCVRLFQSFADPQYEDPVSASDWFAVFGVTPFPLTPEG